MLFISQIQGLRTAIKQCVLSDGQDVQYTSSSLAYDLRRTIVESLDIFVRDLQRDIDMARSENTEEARKCFKTDLDIIYSYTCDFKAFLQTVIIPPTAFEYELKDEFIKKMLYLSDNLAIKIESIDIEASLNGNAIYDYYTPIKQRPMDDLRIIHNNLVRNQWIDKDCTFAGFSYFFGGNGFNPCSPIKWNRSLVELDAFISEMTSDYNNLSKTCKIFVFLKDNVYKPVSYTSLKSARNRALCNGSYWRRIEAVKKDIIPQQ